MVDAIVFKCLPAARGWKVTKNDHLVAHYPTQSIAERAAARQARAEAKRGNQAKAILHKKDGSVYGERSYTQGQHAPKSRTGATVGAR